MLAGTVRRAAALVSGPIDNAQARRGQHRGGVVALIYHRVGRRTSSPVDLPLAGFRAQLDRIASSRRATDLEQACAWLRGADVAGDSSGVVLTFDDGTADWSEVVLPELVARQLPATFYVSTAFVESARSFPCEGRPVSWAGLADMVSTGLVTVGSHTHTHRVLADASATETLEEIDRSVGLIEDRLGVPCRHFAYPKAILGSAAAEVVVRRRFASAALAGNRTNRCGAADLHRLGRHGLTVDDDMAAFERKLIGGAWLEGWLRERRDAMWS
jgi:peptidoglycan/xylan/chitin deacetylase (PgdA/CDA1 family)